MACFTILGALVQIGRIGTSGLMHGHDIAHPNAAVICRAIDRKSVFHPVFQGQGGR